MRRAVAFVAIAFGCLQSAGAAQGRPQPGSVEDIYIARSLRTTRAMPTEFCAESRVGFAGTTFEDQYTFHAIETRTADGRITNAHGNKIGQVRACLGPTSDPLRINFFAAGDLAAVSFVGKGGCETKKADFPEPGITVYRCFLDLTDLPRGYTGGLLTTSTVVSRQGIGEVSDPTGYVQSSVATVRLWKQR